MVALLGAAGCGPVRRYAPAPDVVRWQSAAKYVGEYVTVEGTIVETRNTGKACFLNFHPDWRHTFSAVIFARQFAAFPPSPEDHYRGRTVRLTGVVRDYQGRPEMILDSPEQITVVR
jgi:micrococcal nuclease